MKFFILVLTFLLTTEVFAIQEVKGGGGGLESNGHYMTFYSAKIPFLNKDLDESETPGLTLLMDRVFGLTLPQTQKNILLDALSPAFHSYFRVDEAKISAGDKQEIIGQYAKVTGVSEKDLTLFAITTPESSNTFLFSDFFMLKETEQAAVLFHEAMWALLPKGHLNYTLIINMEMRTQAYLENPDDPEAYYKFYEQLSRLTGYDTYGAYMIIAAALYDMRGDVLKSPGLKNGQMFLRDFVGPEALRCFETKGGTSDCRDSVKKFFRQAKKNNPRSLLFRTLSEHLLAADLSRDFFGLSAQDLGRVYVEFNHPLDEYGSFPLYRAGSQKSLGKLDFQ
jgi:hypothetical protein